MIKFRTEKVIDDLTISGVFSKIDNTAEKEIVIGFDHLSTARDHFDDIKEYITSYIAKNISEVTLNYICEVLRVRINSMFDSLGNTSTCKFEERVLNNYKESITIVGYKKDNYYQFNLNTLYTINITLKKIYK